MMFWCDGQSSNTIDVGDEEGKNYRQIDLERFKIERERERERERGKTKNGDAISTQLTHKEQIELTWWLSNTNRCIWH